MKAVIQRVHHASVEVNQRQVSKIENGLLVLLGIAQNDTQVDSDYLIDKLLNLRVFEDQNGKMNFSIMDTNGALLIVPQFTIMGSCRKGRRPDFSLAASPDKSEGLFNQFVETLKTRWPQVETGLFRNHMSVNLLNDGPVTLIIDSKEKSRP